MRTRRMLGRLSLTVLGFGLASTFSVAQVDVRHADREVGFDLLAPPGLTNRYLVTLMKSCCETCGTGGNQASATDVTVSNQTNSTCEIAVEAYDKDDPLTPLCTEQLTVGPRDTVDFCTIGLHPSISECDVVCSVPEGQGTIVVSSSGGPCENIAVSARVFYYEAAPVINGGFTADVAPQAPPILRAITDSKIVKWGRPTTGD
jgi:hypothetical protein